MTIEHFLDFSIVIGMVEVIRHSIALCCEWRAFKPRPSISVVPTRAFDKAQFLERVARDRRLGWNLWVSRDGTFACGPYEPEFVTDRELET